MVRGLAFPLTSRRPRAAPVGPRGLLCGALALWTGCGEGCVRWQPVSLQAVQTQAVDLRLRRLRVEGPDGRAELVAHRVAWPVMEGHDLGAHAERRYDLAQTRQLWVRGFDPAATGLLVGGVYAAVLAISWIAIFRELPGIRGGPAGP